MRCERRWLPAEPGDATARGVDAATLEARLAELRAGVSDPRLGVLGPDSVSWRVNGEAAILLGAGRAVLLQLAHPWIAAAIDQHSTTLADPIGRFHRTFGTVFTMVFGSLDQAEAAARRLHARHASVEGRLPADADADADADTDTAVATGRAATATPAGPFAPGSRYRANDADALRWVQATLVDSAVISYGLALSPLQERERERLWAESRRVGRLFGLDPAQAPADWAAFERYRDEMLDSPRLAVTPQARRIADALMQGPAGWPPLPRWYLALTAQLLPERLRVGFGLAWSERERQRAQAALARIGRWYPRLPMRLRQVGPHREAVERLVGRGGPGPLTRMSNRLWIGRDSIAETGRRHPR